MNANPHANRHRTAESVAKWILGLVVLIAAAGLAAPPISIAAPMGGGAQKTKKQCKDDRTQCEKDCDQLIDLGNTIQRCKDLCTDDYLMCLPLRAGQPGSKLDELRPSTLPGKNAPILRRGLKGEQSGEPASGETGQPDQTESAK